MMEWRLLMASLVIFSALATADDTDNEETDGQSSRKILGSSVVTSVSVVMETGNGKHTYYSDAVGHPLSKPHIASQVASPINLLNPDRYEFYTFNDEGELVKRLMTLQEIQGIIAGGDGEASNYNSEYHAQIYHPENDVSGVVENVQNVLKEEMEAHKNTLEGHPLIDTPDVSATWNLILPAFFGGDTTEDRFNYVSSMLPLDQSTERMNLSSRYPEDSDENILPNKFTSTVQDISTESKPQEDTSSTYLYSVVTGNTKPIPITITTERLRDNLSSSSNAHYITTELPVRTKVTPEDMKDIYVFDENKIDSSTQTNPEEVTYTMISSSSTSSTTEGNKDNGFSDITERVNLKDKDEMYPKITELVSIITRPTTKASEKTTASVTFPPTTQFTHSSQISQSSATLKPVSIKEKNTETPPSTSSDIINDNYVILTLNNDDKNNNLEQDLNNETSSQEPNDETQLDVTKYDIIADVEQILENVTQKVIAEYGKVPVENYNATEKIEELLRLPDYNRTVTVASSLIDSNKISSTTGRLPSTTTVTTTNMISTTKKQDMSTKGSTTVQESTSDRTTSAQTTQKQPLTTIRRNEILTTTPIPYLKENTKTTTQEVRTTLTKSTTITPLSASPMQQYSTQNITTNKVTTSYMTEPIASKTTPEISEETTEVLIANRFNEPLTTKSSTKKPTTQAITKLTTKPTIAKWDATTIQRIMDKLTTPLFATTFKQTSTNKPTTKVTMSSVGTTNEQTSPVTTSTTNKQTSSFRPTTSDLDKIITASSTTVTNPTSNIATFLTTQRNNTKVTAPEITTFSTTKIPNPLYTATIRTTIPVTLATKVTSTVTPPTSTQAKSTTQPISTTTQPTTTTSQPTSTTRLPSITNVQLTSTATQLTSISTQFPSTTETPTTVADVVNVSEPYRKTEESNQANKVSSQGDTWKLVDTVRPPEYTSNKTPNVVVITQKPVIEPYQPQVTVDLSTQGNFGMPGLNEDMLMFNKMYNELALKIWSALAAKDISSERSAVVSPFGIISMLAMIFLGARGGTSGEMNDVLKLDDILTFNPHLVFKEVTEAVLSRKATSVIVRELYSDSYKAKVQEFYKERVRQFYGGYVEEVDFKKIHNVIRRRTNALISKQTKGQLPQYVEETTLTLRAPLSALSTNLFQADCSLASTEGRDGELYFIVLPSIRQRRLVPIPAAVWRSGFIAGYDPELDATAVSLGTMNQAISTIFIMPGQQGHSAPGDVLLRLEARLLNTTYMPEMWTQLLKSMLPRPGLEIQLPRFLHKSVINATDTLKRMGLEEMFNKNKADFRGINGIRHDLYMSDMMQINEFSICGETQLMHAEIYPSVTEYLENHNEQMRNFKYADYLEENEYDRYLSLPLPLRPRQARLPEVPRLRFDRPFLYFVRHNPTGLILHMGRFNPRLLT